MTMHKLNSNLLKTNKKNKQKTPQQQTNHTRQNVFKVVTFLQLFEALLPNTECTVTRTEASQKWTLANDTMLCFYVYVLFNSGIIVAESYLYDNIILQEGNWTEYGGYRNPVQPLTPYNYALRHAVKCYTNNNINRGQLQGQCKLYRRLLIP